MNAEGEGRPAVIPAEVGDERFAFLVQLSLPHIVTFSTDPEPDRTPCFVDYTDLSWSRLSEPDEERRCLVTQGGPQRLWDRLEEAHTLWLRSGQPGFERYGMTITPDDRQLVWLDRPDSGNVWEL